MTAWKTETADERRSETQTMQHKGETWFWCYVEYLEEGRWEGHVCMWPANRKAR